MIIHTCTLRTQDREICALKWIGKIPNINIIKAHRQDPLIYQQRLQDPFPLENRFRLSQSNYWSFLDFARKCIIEHREGEGGCGVRNTTLPCSCSFCDYCRL